MFISEVSMQDTICSIDAYNRGVRLLNFVRFDVRDTAKGEDPFIFVKKAIAGLKSPVYFGLEESQAQSWCGHPSRFDLDRGSNSTDAALAYINKTPGVRMFESYWNQGIFMVVIHSEDHMPATVLKFEIGGVREGKTKAIPYNRIHILSFPEVLRTSERLLKNPASTGVGLITIDYRRWKKLIQAIIQYHSLRKQLVDGPINTCSTI